MIFNNRYALLPGKAMAPHSSTLAWKIPWTEEPVGYSPRVRQESDTTERLHFNLSLSCTGEGNGNPLQYLCLENPRDGSLVGCHLWGHTELDTTDVTQQQHALLLMIFCIILTGGSVVKFPPANVGDVGDDPWVWKIPRRGTWQPAPEFLPGKPHGQRSLAGYSL